MRPIFTVHAGEFLAGQYIEREFKKNVWVPRKDTGIDLLVTDLVRHGGGSLFFTGASASLRGKAPKPKRSRRSRLQFITRAATSPRRS
jgi:hypothetical protein